ncbi:MAG: tetratricopeptide repeat protein [Sedimentisphaerales bacterium]
MKNNRNITGYLLWIAVINVILFSGTTIAALRGFRVGAKMPEFSAVNINGVDYAYRYGVGKPLLVMFISMGQQSSGLASADINQIISDFGKDANNLEITIVVEDSNDTFKKSEEFQSLKKFNIFIDSEYKLWGKFGVIATPTLVVSDANDTIAWIKAGYNYDFIPDVRTHINQALGLSHVKVENEVQVKTVENDTISARVTRHLQMAGILSEKGKIESAITEISKARELDPNSNEVKLRLAELLCRANKNRDALDVIAAIQVDNSAEKGKLLVLSGWANRQMGELNAAQNYLLEALTIDPTSTRALFELGNVYRAQGQAEKAMEAYYDALAIMLKEPGEPLESQTK